MIEITSLFPASFPREAVGLTVFGVSFSAVGIGAGFLLGRNRLVNVIMGIYVSLVLTRACSPLLPKDFFLSEAGVFAAILVAFVLADRALFWIQVSSVPQDLLWRVVATGLLTAGMLTSVLVTLLPKKTVAAFPIPVPVAYFGTPVAAALWLFLPLVVLALLNRRGR